MFSLVPDGREHMVPSSVTQRYGRLAKRLGIETHLHSLRHYSATELIAAGVDIRTVAGRLGHSGGGVTTLRVYAAWLAEADQRAAAGLAARAPSRPVGNVSRSVRAMTNPRTPRERLAIELREQILAGVYPPGTDLPGIKALGIERGISSSTVHRAYALLREWGFVHGAVGERARVALPAVLPAVVPEAESETSESDRVSSARPMIRLDVRRGTESVATLMADADPGDGRALGQLLLDAVRRHGDEESAIGQYEMVISTPAGDCMGVFVASQR